MVEADSTVPWRTLAKLRESFESSNLPITVDVVDWNSCSDFFRGLVAAQLVRIA